ncbi:MAG: flippase-like domain-containing protein [Anaerolineae bacterium]|nr:flippase-like domain-containing protein [Anaerolineae bacterium]
MKKQVVTILVRLALSVILLGLLFFLIDREALIKAFSSVDPLYYVLGLAAYGATAMFWALRWYLFIRASGEKVSYLRALRTLLIGLFYAMFLPTIVGTDVGRMYELGRDANNNKSNVVSTVLLDRLMGMITLTLMAVTALLLGSQYAADRSVVWTVIGALAVLVAGWIVFFNRRVMEVIFRLVFALPGANRLEAMIREIYEALYLLHNQPRLLLVTGLASLLNSISETLAALLAARALGIDVAPVYFFIFMPLIWLIMIIPISISGLGLREGAFAFFFTQVGVSAADAVAVSLVFYSLNVIVATLGGIVLFQSSFIQTWRKLRSSRSVSTNHHQTTPTVPTLETQDESSGG